MPSTKRAGDELEGGPKKKAGGLGHRTGQACDRCRIRKIKCDARIGGCSPCLQNNTECKTTDRITGRANARGHAESLESENNSLRTYVIELQQQLREHGLDPKASVSVPPVYVPAHPYWNQNEHQGSWGNLDGGGGLASTPGRADRHTAQSSLLPDFRPGCIGDNYLGVSSNNNWLSPIEGTSLALFGMKLDVAEFLPPESDPRAAPMSYRTFLLYALGKAHKLPQPALPAYEVSKQYAEWYFKSVQIFIPALHRPDFMKLLSNIYNGQYQPSAAETVMVHMVTMIMQFQRYCRNGAEEMRDESMAHYHYALSFIPDLITGHTLQDIQALVLICSQLRNQPRPGAAWMFTNAVFGLAVEVGLHRSASNWQGDAAERDSHVIEMRKRIFWTILLLHANVSGKLGRPMPIRLEDFDIEIPEVLPDNLPEERSLTKWRKCSFRAAIQGFKLLRISMQVYSTVYCIKPGANSYDASVQSIDKQMDDFREQLPAELSGGPATVDEDRCPALYLILSEGTNRLILHHPSLCRSTSPKSMAENLDICLDASNKSLSAATQLKDLNSLDTTWMQATEFLASIFTTLFVHTQRQAQMSSADLGRLERDMEAWLEVMKDAGNLLGAGSRLVNAVKAIIDYSIVNIRRHLAARTASAGLSASNSLLNSPTQHTQVQTSTTSPDPYMNTFTNGQKDTHQLSQRDDRGSRQGDQHDRVSHSYPDPQGASMHYYRGKGVPRFETPGYEAGDLKPQVEAPSNGEYADMPSQVSYHGHDMQMAAHQAPPFLANQLYQHTPQDGFAYGPAAVDPLYAGPFAWRNFADSVMSEMGGQDFFHSASALMALGGDRTTGVVPNNTHVGSIGELPPAQGDQTAWPLLQYGSHAGEPR